MWQPRSSLLSDRRNTYKFESETEEYIINYTRFFQNRDGEFSDCGILPR